MNAANSSNNIYSKGAGPLVRLFFACLNNQHFLTIQFPTLETQVGDRHGLCSKFAFMSDLIINKVTESALVSLDLEEYFPKEEIAVFDMKDYLFMGLILKEKDFRESLKNLDLEPFRNKIVAVTCTADAVIPMWAYMLVASYLEPVTKEVMFGSKEALQQQLLLNNISKIPATDYLDKRVVIKGCGELPVGEAAYLHATKMLRPVAKSIMYGEPCSTVPIFKKK